MSDKIFALDIDNLKNSIRKEVELDVRQEVEFELYYGFFRDLPIYMLSEQFIKIRNTDLLRLEECTEKGYALLMAIALKISEFYRGVDCLD